MKSIETVRRPLCLQENNVVMLSVAKHLIVLKEIAI